MDTKIRCALGLILNKDNKILLLLRHENDRSFPNIWCLPGGKAFEGEAIEDCLLREVKEETNLDVYTYKFLYSTENSKYIIYFYECVCENYNVVISNEHKNYSFFSTKDLININLGELTRDFLMIDMLQ